MVTTKTHGYLNLEKKKKNRCNSSVALATFQVLNIHMWLVIMVLDNTNIEQ